MSKAYLKQSIMEDEEIKEEETSEPSPSVGTEPDLKESFENIAEEIHMFTQLLADLQEKMDKDDKVEDDEDITLKKSIAHIEKKTEYLLQMLEILRKLDYYNEKILDIRNYHGFDIDV